MKAIFSLIALSLVLVACSPNNTNPQTTETNQITQTSKKPVAILHKAESRGHALHDWLESFHTFSFADYFDPNRVEFGALRVINEDKVLGGEGFHTHPHDNMEIITIPLAGGVKHGDNMGNSDVVNAGEVQIMSAGTGLTHSEMNASDTETVHFLQIWVKPKKRNVEPRYQKVAIKEGFKKNDFQTIVTPEEHQEQNSAWIHQDSWFSLANFDAKTKKNYKIHKEGNGVYMFIIKGKVQIGNQILNEKDGFGIYNIDNFDVEALEDAEILVMEVPMK